MHAYNVYRQSIMRVEHASYSQKKEHTDTDTILLLQHKHSHAGIGSSFLLVSVESNKIEFIDHFD